MSAASDRSDRDGGPAEGSAGPPSIPDAPRGAEPETTDAAGTDAAGRGASDAAHRAELASWRPRPRQAVLADLAARGFRSQARLGQNFLFDPQLLEAFLADAGVAAGERILEVGAGPGTLTERLLARGAEVVSAEIDPLLIAHLEARGPHPGLTLVPGDALGPGETLAEPLAAALAAGDRPFRLVANLPYAIATPLVMRLVAREPRLAGIAVLVQAEVAERWVSPPGGREYGAASVLLALAGRGRIARRVSPRLFTPVPRVESAFYVWTPAAEPPADLPEVLEFVRGVFRHRRKMLRAILRDRLPEGDPAWARAGVDPRARPEEVPPEAHLALARIVRAGEGENGPLR